MRQEFLFNNEAICLVAIASAINSCGPLTVDKCLIAATLMLHPPTVAHFKHGRTRISGVDDFVASRPELIYNLDERFQSVLPLAINSIVIGLGVGILERSDDGYALGDEGFLKGDLGKRAESIGLATRKLEKLLNSFS